MGKVDPLKSFVGVFCQFLLFTFPCVFIALLTAHKVFSIKTIIKILYITFYVILLLGIVDFIVYSFNVGPLKQVLSATSNIKILKGGIYVKAFAGKFPRVQSVYFEPGFFAEYIFIMLPIMYKVSLSKFSVLKHKILNKFVKKTTIPLIWLDIILTRSPIWLIFCILSTTIYYLVFLFNKNKKKFVLLSTIIPLVFGIMFIYVHISELKQFDNPAFNRIGKVIKNINNVNELISVEPSLGTRICNIINLLCIGNKHPVLGVGHSNLRAEYKKQILSGNSPIALTDEVLNVASRENGNFQNPPLTHLYVRHGLVALFLFYYFIFKIIILLIKNKKYYPEREQLYISSLIGSLISYILTSCYDMTMLMVLPYFLLGISLNYCNQPIRIVRQNLIETDINNKGKKYV